MLGTGVPMRMQHVKGPVVPPRRLKSSPSANIIGNPPLAEVQRLVQVLHADKTSDSEVAELCRILRENGRDIVAQDPECLDGIFDMIRQAAIGDGIGLSSRAELLQIIELQASGWPSSLRDQDARKVVLRVQPKRTDSTILKVTAPCPQDCRMADGTSDLLLADRGDIAVVKEEGFAQNVDSALPVELTVRPLNQKPPDPPSHPLVLESGTTRLVGVNGMCNEELASFPAHLLAPVKKKIVKTVTGLKRPLKACTPKVALVTLQVQGDTTEPSNVTVDCGHGVGKGRKGTQGIDLESTAPNKEPEITSHDPSATMSRLPDNTTSHLPGNTTSWYNSPEFLASIPLPQDSFNDVEDFTYEDEVRVRMEDPRLEEQEEEEEDNRGEGYPQITVVDKGGYSTVHVDTKYGTVLEYAKVVGFVAMITDTQIERLSGEEQQIVFQVTGTANTRKKAVDLLRQRCKQKVTKLRGARPGLCRESGQVKESENSQVIERQRSPEGPSNAVDRNNVQMSEIRSKPGWYEVDIAIKEELFQRVRRQKGLTKDSVERSTDTRLSLTTEAGISLVNIKGPSSTAVRHAAELLETAALMNTLPSEMRAKKTQAQDCRSERQVNNWDDAVPRGHEIRVSNSHPASNSSLDGQQGSTSTGKPIVRRCLGRGRTKSRTLSQTSSGGEFPAGDMERRPGSRGSSDSSQTQDLEVAIKQLEEDLFFVPGSVPAAPVGQVPAPIKIRRSPVVPGGDPHPPGPDASANEFKRKGTLTTIVLNEGQIQVDGVEDEADLAKLLQAALESLQVKQRHSVISPSKLTGSDSRDDAGPEVECVKPAASLLGPTASVQKISEKQPLVKASFRYTSTPNINPEKASASNFVFPANNSSIADGSGYVRQRSPSCADSTGSMGDSSGTLGNTPNNNLNTGYLDSQSNREPVPYTSTPAPEGSVRAPTTNLTFPNDSSFMDSSRPRSNSLSRSELVTGRGARPSIQSLSGSSMTDSSLDKGRMETNSDCHQRLVSSRCESWRDRGKTFRSSQTTLSSVFSGSWEQGDRGTVHGDRPSRVDNVSNYREDARWRSRSVGRPEAIHSGRSSPVMMESTRRRYVSGQNSSIVADDVRPSHWAKVSLRLVRQPIFPEMPMQQILAIEAYMDGGSLSAKARRHRFQETRQQLCKTPTEVVMEKITYTRDFLLHCARSPLSREKPADWDTFRCIHGNLFLPEVTAFFDPSMHPEPLFVPVESSHVIGAHRDKQWGGEREARRQRCEGFGLPPRKLHGGEINDLKLVTEKRFPWGNISRT